MTFDKSEAAIAASVGDISGVTACLVQNYKRAGNPRSYPESVDTQRHYVAKRRTGEMRLIAKG
jgi:hypothetical protein